MLIFTAVIFINHPVLPIFILPPIYELNFYRKINYGCLFILQKVLKYFEFPLFIRFNFIICFHLLNVFLTLYKFDLFI
jgi:hypothetical protein